MADDAKSIGKSLAEISASLKEGINRSEGNQAAEKEASNEDRRQRVTLFGSLKASMDKMGEGLKSLGTGKISGGIGGLFAGLGGVIMTFISPILNFFGKAGPIAKIALKFVPFGKAIGGIFGPIFNIFGKAGPIAKVATKFLPFLGPAGMIAKLGLKFLGPLILLIDGFIGFFKGWSNSEEGNIGLRIVDGIQGGVAQILSGLTLGFVSFDAINEFIQPFFDYIKDWFTGIFAIWDDESLGFGEKLWLTLKEYFVLWVDGMMLTFTLVKDGIMAAIDGLIYIFSPEALMAAASAIGDAFMAISDWVFGVFEEPITYMSMIMARITNALKVMFYDVIAAINGFTETLPFGMGFSVLGGSEAAKKASQDAVMEGMRDEAAYQSNLSEIRERQAEEARKAAEAQAAREKAYLEKGRLEKERLEKVAKENELKKNQAENDQREAEVRTSVMGGSSSSSVNIVRGGTSVTNVQQPALESRPPPQSAMGLLFG